MLGTQRVAQLPQWLLEGLPNLQDIGNIRVGENTEEIMRCDLAIEFEAVPLLREAIEYCEQAKDYVSRELFEGILVSEEEHLDWLETRLELIEKVGLQNYQQSKM